MDTLTTLPEELTIYTIAQVRSTLLQALEPVAARGVLQVAAATVAEVDAAGVQLLLALHNSLAKRGAALQFASVSPVLRKAATMLGMHTLTDAMPAETTA